MVIQELLVFLIALIGFGLFYVVLEEVLFRKPKRVLRVPRKRRKLNKLLDRRWGGLFDVVRVEKIGVDQYLLHLRNKSVYLKVPYFEWEIQPANNVEAMTSPGVQVWEWVGYKKGKKTALSLQRLQHLGREAQVLRKKVVEKEAYENKLARDILGEAHKFVKAEKGYKIEKS